MMLITIRTRIDSNIRFRPSSFPIFTSVEEHIYRHLLSASSRAREESRPQFTRVVRFGTFRLSLWWCESGFLLQTCPRRPVRAVSRKSEQPWCDPRHTAAQISRRRPPGANEQQHRAPARPPKLEGGDKAGATQLSELSPCNSPHATPVVPGLEPAARKTDNIGRAENQLLVV